MRNPLDRLSIPVRVAVIYAALSSAWIILSGGFVRWALGESHGAWLAETTKGLLYVAVSAMILRTLIGRFIARSEKAEAALSVSDERAKFALEGAGDGVWDWNGETGRNYYSPGWKAMLGHTDPEIGDQHEEWVSRIHPDDRAMVTQQFSRHSSGAAATYTCEHRIRTKEGTYKWVLARGRIVARAADGRPLRAIGTHTDITARKEAEARTADALNFQQTILQSAPVGIVTYRADGSTVTANEAAAKFVGATVEQVLRQNFRELASWRDHGLLAAAERALTENTVVFHSTRVISTFGKETWGEMTFTPFRYDGEQRLLLIVRDLTEQHVALERMRLLNAALESAPAGWVVTDVHGVMQWANPGFTKLTGYTLEEAVGKRMSLLKSGRHSAGFYANLWQTIRSGEVWQGELYNRRKDGTFYYERMTVAPVRGVDDAITNFVAIKEDVTGQHELEQRLARSQRLESVGLLASGLAHDLNNMLAPIMLSVGLIKSRHGDRETHDLLDMMQQAAQRGAGVVQQILTFARGVEGQRTQLDVRPLVKELGQLARETFPREIRVIVEVPPGALLVEGDVTQLHQVLLNLAVNARDAMPEGGVLTLKAGTVIFDAEGARTLPGGKPGKYVRLAVIDTGTGITPEVMEHLFEPFFTTKPRGKGTGLGLSTVYGIVRSHGGTVDVQSRLGEGTELSVLLPASAETAAAPVSPAKVPAPVQGAGRYVLVVDDEASIRQITSQVLRRIGFITLEAEDGVQALKILRLHPGRFSVAIVDLMMPGMNGYKLVAEIRLLEPVLPIVVASGMMGDADAGQDTAALAAQGVRTVLRKPFAEEELMRALRGALGAGSADDAPQNKS